VPQVGTERSNRLETRRWGDCEPDSTFIEACSAKETTASLKTLQNNALPHRQRFFENATIK